MTAIATSVEEAVRALDGTYYLAREVADALNCSVTLLGKLRDEDPKLYGPSQSMGWRGGYVFLYTTDDVQRLQAHLINRWPDLAVDGDPDTVARAGRSRSGPGRPALFHPRELRERQSRHSRAGYWHGRAKSYAKVGETVLANDAQAKCDAIRAQLTAEREKRAGIAPAPSAIDLVVS